MRKILFVLWVLTLVGCGSSSDTFLGQTGLLDQSSAQQVFGRAILESPATDAKAEITNLNNQSLGFPTARVDASGNFRIDLEDRPLPPEFRVRILHTTDSPWNLPLISNVQDYSSNKVVYCNILTTLAALRRERTGTTQEDSVSWVKQLFRIPSSVDPGYGIEESRQSPFRHSVFLNQAQQNGGVSSYVTDLVQSDPTNNQALVTTLLLSVGKTLGKSVLNKVVGESVGLIAQSLGLNTGNSAEIVQILDDLSQIEAGIARLEAELQSDFEQLSNQIKALAIYSTFQDQTVALEPLLASVQVQTNNLTTTAANTPITNLPQPQNQDVQNLVTNFQAFDSQTAVAQLTDNLVGKNGLSSLLSLYRQLLSIKQGIQPGGNFVWRDSPVLTNKNIVYPFETQFEFYQNQQTLAFNILVETANVSFSPTVIAEAQASARKFYEGLVSQEQMSKPALASDFFLSNPQAAFQQREKAPRPTSPSGTLFYTQMQDQAFAYNDVDIYQSAFDARRTFVEADEGRAFLSQTQAFQAANLSMDWRLATLDELEQLRELALLAQPNDVRAGLERLGFQLPPNWGGTVWYDDPEVQRINGTIPGSAGTTITIQGNYPVKVYDFEDGSTYGYQTEDVLAYLVNIPRAYIQAHYQSFDSDQPLSEVRAAGFQPTEAPTLELHSDGTRILATLGSQDITEYCLWESSDSTQLDVGNFSETAGILTWHPRPDRTLLAQTITATIPGMDASTGEPVTFTSSILVEVPTPAPTRNLEAILLTPSNLAVGNLDTIFYRAVGYYSDQTVADITTQVDWTLELPDGTAYPSGQATIDNLSSGALVFSPPVTETNIVVKAALEGAEGSTLLQVAVSP